MAKVDFIRLGKTREDGKAELRVRFYVNKTFRPLFQSGLFIEPKRFISLDETERCRRYKIDIPKQGKLNFLEVKELREIETKFALFLARIQKICDTTSERHKDELTTDWIENSLRLLDKAKAATEDITYHYLVSLVEEEQKEIEEESARASKRSIFDYMEEYLSKKKLSYDQTKGFRSIMRTFARYEAYIRMSDRKRRSFHFDVDAVTKADLLGYREYLAKEHLYAKQYAKQYEKLLAQYPVEITVMHKTASIGERGENTIIKQMKRLKAFFRWMIEQEYTTNRPFEGIEIGSETYGTPVYITIEERNIIADSDLSNYPSLSVQRDIFVFQCLIGCRVGDLMRFTEGNISGGFLQYIPNKTKDEKPITARVPLLDKAKELIEKYKGKDRKGRLFPFISAQKYNDAIKEIFRLCGITRNVAFRNPTTGEEEIRPINEVASSHMARRTFVGGLYAKVKDPNLIGKMSGHVEGSKAFVRYRKIDDDLLSETVLLIE